MQEFSLTEINELILKSSSFVDDFKKQMNNTIIGQEDLVNKIIHFNVSKWSFITRGRSRFSNSYG